MSERDRESENEREREEKGLLNTGWGAKVEWDMAALAVGNVQW